MLHALFMLLVFGLAQAAAGDASPGAPPRRAHHAMVYDPVAGRVLLTGGSTPVDDGKGFEFFDDLWSFDGKAWTALPPSGSKRSGVALAFDSRGKRVLSFGGYETSGSLGDLRQLEAAGWKTLGEHPELLAAEPGFVYDPARDRFVEFGGSARPRQCNGDTWEFDGKQWTKLAIENPPARQAHVMVQDTARNRTVVFGGMSERDESPLVGDTWEFDGKAWTEKKVTGPAPRMGAGAAFDSKRKVLILFGGGDRDGFLGDTWSWDGTAWKKLADTGPEPRAMGYLAYDAKRDRVVLFGGRKGYPDGDLDDTWEWDGKAWKRVP